MIASRWWLVALAATSVGVFGLLALDGGTAPQFIAAVVILGVFVPLFLALRRRAGEGDAPALVLTAATILFAGGLTSLMPEFATVQFLAFPLVWALSGTTRQGLIGSLLVALSVGIGFWFSFGERPDALPIIITTQVLSFGFSVAMGLWMTHIASLGEEKARLLDELTAVQDQLTVASHDAGVVAERARMSREVHDTVAQSLTGLVMLAQQARRRFASDALDDQQLELIESSARDALAETRAIVAASAPIELLHDGLEDAFSQLVERFSRATDIRVSLVLDVGVPLGLSRDTEVVLLRCAQEALANVRKHAHAAAVDVVLTVNETEARLSVADDGRGFDPTMSTGFGLSGLRDRLALAGGMLDLDGTAGATTLTAIVPHGGHA